MTHETEEDLLKETEDEFEISLQNSPNQPSQGDNWDMLADTQEFNNTFGKTEDDQGMQVFFSNSKQSVNNKETAKEDIIVGETVGSSEKHKSSNERNIFEQNIEVLDFKFNGDVSETSSRDMTIESVSNPENTQKSSLKDTMKGQFETKSKTHFSFQTDPFRKTGANQKKGEATHVAKNPQSDRVLNLRKKSNSSNLEISPLKQLLNNLKMSMFKSKDEYQKQLRFERKNRFGSINHVSSKTLNLKKKMKVSTERKTTNDTSKNKVQRSEFFYICFWFVFSYKELTWNYLHFLSLNLRHFKKKRKSTIFFEDSKSKIYQKKAGTARKRRTNSKKPWLPNSNANSSRNSVTLKTIPCAMSTAFEIK